MGTVCGLQPEQDFFHTTLKFNWIYQWLWVLLFLDWCAFYMASTIDNEPDVSGCLWEKTACDFVHADTDEPYTGERKLDSVAFVHLCLCLLGSSSMITAQIFSCLIAHCKGNVVKTVKKAAGIEVEVDDGDEDEEESFQLCCSATGGQKGYCEAGFMLLNLPIMMFLQLAALGVSIYKYYLLGEVPGANWFARVTEVAWMVVVLITATRLEYLKTVKALKMMIGLVKDEESDSDSEEGGCIGCCLKANNWASLCCKMEGERDPLWVIGCDSPIRHIWFVTIFLDWAQTLNYIHYEGEYLNGVHVKTVFAIPSLLFTIWGTSLLLTAQLSRCHALHMQANGEGSTKKIDDSKMIASVLAMADAIWDEIPTAALTLLFWIMGGLNGPDRLTSTLSILQFLFAFGTFLIHAIQTWRGYAGQINEGIFRRNTVDLEKEMRMSVNGELYIPGVESSNCCQVTFLGGIVLGAIAPLLPILHLLAVCAARNTLVDVLADCGCFRLFTKFCCAELDDNEETPKLARNRMEGNWQSTHTCFSETDFVETRM